jgi:hypothetical protein
LPESKLQQSEQGSNHQANKNLITLAAILGLASGVGGTIAADRVFFKESSQSSRDACVLHLPPQILEEIRQLGGRSGLRAAEQAVQQALDEQLADLQQSQAQENQQNTSPLSTPTGAVTQTSSPTAQPTETATQTPVPTVQPIETAESTQAAQSRGESLNWQNDVPPGPNCDIRPEDLPEEDLENHQDLPLPGQDWVNNTLCAARDGDITVDEAAATFLENAEQAGQTLPSTGVLAADQAWLILYKRYQDGQLPLTSEAGSSDMSRVLEGGNEAWALYFMPKDGAGNRTLNSEAAEKISAIKVK